MKRWPFLLILAVLIAGVASSSIHNIPRIAEARMPMVIMSGSTVASGGGSSCAGDQFFGWSMENQNVLTGTPAGCTANATTDFTFDGDSTAISSDQNQDGTNSLYIRYAGDYASIPVTLSGDGESGTIDVYVYFASESIGNWMPWVGLSYNGGMVEDTDTYIAIGTDGSDHLMLAYNYGGGHVNLSSTVDITGLSGWTHVVGKWDRGESTTMSITVGATESTGSSSLSALSDTPNTLVINNPNEIDSHTLYWDLIKCYDTYQ